MKTRGTLWEPILWWLYSAVAVTGVCGILYVSMQQSFRQNLDDPQIQMAEDAANALAHGEVPAGVVQRGVSVDLRSSLSPWISVYDSKGMPLESSGVLDSAPAEIPHGTFDTSTWLPAKTYSIAAGQETRFTWQAAPDVRQAVVLVALKTASNGAQYVAVGRNMREIENRIVDVGDKIFVAWVVILGTLLVASLIVWRLVRPQM